MNSDVAAVEVSATTNKTQKQKRAFHVDILAAIFSIGSWVCIQGLWVELPLIVQALPEGWTLPSILCVIITIANIGPITFSVLNHFFPRTVTEKRGIYVTILVGIVSTGLLSFYWKSTTNIWGHERSVGFFVLVFFLGMVDCGSRVLYVPFMSSFQEIYLVSYFVGEGLSGFLPSVFALIQGVGGSPKCHVIYNATTNSTIYELTYSPPLFSVEVFFYLLLGMFMASALAFHLMNYKSIVKNALIAPEKIMVMVQVPQNKDESVDLDLDPGEVKNTSELFYYLAAVQCIVCFVSNGILYSIQTYSCLPYGNLVYHLSVTLSAMSNPIVCMFLQLPILQGLASRGSINFGCVLATLASAYVTIAALESPNPVLIDYLSGKIIMVFAWVAVISFFTYVKVSTATLLKRLDGKRGLWWFGAMTQVGSGVGSLFSFYLVNYTTLFTSYSSCDAVHHNQN